MASVANEASLATSFLVERIHHPFKGFVPVPKQTGQCSGALRDPPRIMLKVTHFRDGSEKVTRRATVARGGGGTIRSMRTKYYLCIL